MIKDDKNNTDKIICLELCFIFICLVNFFKTSHGREENGEERRESRGVEGRGGGHGATNERFSSIFKRDFVAEMSKCLTQTFWRNDVCPPKYRDCWETGNLEGKWQIKKGNGKLKRKMEI